MLKILKMLKVLVVGGKSPRVKLLLRLILFFKRRSMLGFANYFANRLQIKHGIFISPKTNFDETLELRHPIGIIIGEGVRIGKNVIVYQNVTLGGARIGDGKASNYPIIGENTVIFSGAAIIGNVKVGHNCTIGANSVVTKDVPPNSTAVGAPARIIKKVSYE